MARVRVITDSGSDLSAAMAAEHNITVVPLSIRFGSEEFPDGSVLTPDEFWSRCASSPVLPETSAPSPGTFQKAFLAAAGDGYDGVVCLTMSGGVSATLQSAKTAADTVVDQIPVRVVDSRTLTMAQGLIAIEASELAATGATIEEVVACIETLSPRATVFGVVDTLEHLEKGGRIGGARALLGSLLSIKPVVTMVDGSVGEESKQRTRARSLRYVADKALNAPPLERLAVCNGAAVDIDSFLAMIDGVSSVHPRVMVDLGPVIGTHTGPGTIGLCFITKE